MYLTLEVVSPQAASMGTEQRKVVGPEGLTIGRVPGNDWIIADPYVSKHHARISFANGRFYVEGLGRNPIAIGRSDNALSGNQPQPLSNGDRLFIDQYEILVCVVQGDMPGAALSAGLDDDPFASGHSSSTAGAWNGSVLDSGTDTTPLDPLSALGGALPKAAEPALPPANWQQGSPLADHVQIPPARTPIAGGIPDNWDRTGLTQMEARRRDAAETPRPPQSAQLRRTAFQSAPSRDGFAGQPNPNRYAATSASRAAPALRSDQQALVHDLSELLRGAGLTDQDLSPEVIHELGAALRIVVQGVMDVLQARSEIKSQFRLPVTRVQAAENNPLKFSSDVESALRMLLVQRNPGYLGTAAAFEDAFSDIRVHQIAMLEGLRAGFEAMFESFGPEKLAQEFASGAKRGRLLGSSSGKSRLWELYVQRYKELGEDRDDTFRRLFGDVFAEAYEDQLERIKLAGRRPARNK